MLHLMGSAHQFPSTKFIIGRIKRKSVPSSPGRSRESDIPTHCHLDGADVLALIKFPLLSLALDSLLWACQGLKAGMTQKSPEMGASESQVWGYSHKPLGQ